MAAVSTFTFISLGGFIILTLIGISTITNEIYNGILKILLTIVSVVTIHQILTMKREIEHVQIKPKTKQINFRAFEQNQNLYQDTQQMRGIFSNNHQGAQSEIFQVQRESQEKQINKDKEKKLDKEQRKKNLQNYFQNDQELTSNHIQKNGGSMKYFYADDSRSLHSQHQISYQQPIMFGKSSNEIQQKNKNTEQLLQKLIKKMSDAHMKAEELIFKSFIPTFVKEFQDHLVNVNRLMKEHFQQKIIEIDIFFANKPFDINSNKHEKSIGLKSITLEDVFYLKNQVKGRQREPIRAPTTVDKFTKDKIEFIKECELLELFTEILDLSLLNRNLISDKKELLIKLIDFCENNKPQYQQDGLYEKVVSDYELLFTLFINVILKCVKYEKQKYFKEINSINQNSLKSIEVCIIALDSFNLTEPINDQISRNFIIQQKLEQLDQEPQFHYYSDYIVKALIKDKESKSIKLNDHILYTTRDANSLNGFVCYYLLHLLNIPKQYWQHLQQMEMDQKMIKCLIRMAKDISYLVTNV